MKAVIVVTGQGKSPTVKAVIVVTGQRKSPTVKAGIELRSVAVEADALSLGQQGSQTAGSQEIMVYDTVCRQAGGRDECLL